MSGQQQTLKWGDVVRIHGVNLSKKVQDKGLILSKGFTDSNVYYQKYRSFDEVNFYRQSLFQLLPRSNFDVHDQLLDQTLPPQQRQILKARAVSQIEGLYTSLKRSKGSEIKYGAEVVFKHVESNSFLRGVMKAADTGDGAFRIQVNESVSSYAVFRIKSHRSYEHQGDPIYYDDALLIYHQGADCYMNFAQNNKAIRLDEPFQVAKPEFGSIQQSYVNKRPSIKKPADKRISIINENKSKCYWKFILHNTYDNFQQKSKIKSHDIVYFEHTKNKGLISSSLSGTNFYLKESNQHQLYNQCFWELIPQQVNEFGPEKCDNFWARNTITGKFLQYKENRVQIQSKEKVEGGGFINGHLVNLIFNQEGNKLERGSEIKLNRDLIPKIIEYAQQKTKKYSLIDVPQLKEDSFCIKKVEDEQMMNIQYIVSSHQPIGRFVNVIFTENQKTKQIINSLGNIKDKEKSKWFKDQFFMKLNEDQLINVINIIKLLAGKIYGTDYENIGPSGNTPNTNIQKILVQTGITQLLIQILFILYEPFKEIQRNNQPSEDRAIRNKISEIFECTYKLLEKIAVGNQDNRIYLSRWVDLFLEHSNNINRSYIQECLVCILQNNPLSIEATINKDKINELISSFFEEAKRQNFLTTKYLRLFSTFIKCQDRVIKENQQIILDCFFKNNANHWSFKFKLQEKEEQQIANPLQLPTNHPVYDKILKYKVQIALGRQDFSSIPKFFKDWGSKWDYFLAYVNLLADICMDRNSESIQNVSALISLQIVAVILNDPQINNLNETLKKDNEDSLKNGILLHPISNIHEPFVRIAHYVYINNEKFIPIKRIKSISSWYRNQNEEKGKYKEERINKTKRAFEGQKQEEQKCYLMNILSYIEKFIQMCNQDHSSLNILLTVLNLLKETIILGLWQGIQQFRKLIPLIIMRINKIENNKFFDADEQTKNRYTSQEYVNKNKDKLKLNRPELNLIIQCKVKATEIFKLMNQLEIDIRLRYMMNFFKGLYQATESFEDYNKIFDDNTETEDKKIAERNEVAREEFLKNQSASILGQVKKISQDQDIMLKESIWYNKVKELTPFEYDPSVALIPSKDRYLFQGQKNSPSVNTFQQMVLAMFELPVFENHKLLNASLKMLREMFEQRKDMIDKFKRILICGKGNLLEVYMTLKYMRQKFNMLTNLNIDKYKDMDDPTFPFAFYKTFDSGIKQHSKRSGILQDLFFLARTLKEDINLKNIQSLMLVEDSIFNKKTVYNHLNQKEKNNNLFQRVNLAEEIYVPLIEYIKIIGKKSDIPENHRRILFGIYNYLALLCFNNLQAKQVLMKYIPCVLPHLSLKVGADNFLYEVCVNNKLLVNNQALVSQIIDGALNACIRLDQPQLFTAILAEKLNRDIVRHSDYQKGKILHSLRGILLYNDEGHKHNQQLLINRLQDNKYKRLIFKGKCEFISTKKENFALNPEQSYIANHFQLFAGLVQTQNFINIGKLQNIHPYPVCLQYLKSTNRWQLRRTIRSYINRLYYVNKDRDIFLFEEFIRKEFKIINEQMNDLVELHRNKLITDETPIPNGIRFKYALSEVLQLILEILITLHQMLLKPEFLKVLDREIAKQEKKPDNQRQIHDQFVKLMIHLGCLNKLYPKTKTIAPFIKEVYKHISKVMMKFETKYLNSKASNEDESALQQADDLGVDTEKKSYVYDHSKSFFRNLNSMIRDIKAKQARQEMKKKMQRRKLGNKDGEQNQEEIKKDSIEQIFSVQGETTLKPMRSKKERREIFASQYKPHIQTANSKIFKVIAKPLLGQNQENIELNRRLSEVKTIIEDSPSFRKLRDDQFYKLVTTITNINQISLGFYEKDWLAVGEKKSIPVVSLRQILTNSFKLIMKYQNEINDNEKVFVIKLARCYITEAVEGNQSYKLPVDKWSPEYYGQDEVDENGETEFVRRQNLIEICGGSDFIISLLSENLAAKGSTELLNETLLLGIAYLFNGNTKCQNSLLASLKKDSNNSMLVSISHLIKVIGTFLIEVRKIKESGKERSFAYKIQDTYDYFDVKENTITKQFGYKSFDKFELMAEINYEKALCRLFRFLQLFCENNNVKMKHFLREQINEDQCKKATSINFIDEGTLLLRKLFKVMNEKIVTIPPCILDFINEITQMPCIQNQQTFMKSTFFEDISYLADFFEDQKNILLRKFDPVPQNDEDPYNQLKGIYQKGIELALVNFEGNDNFLFWEFLTKCQPKFLWICIKQNLLIMLREKARDWGLQRQYSEEEIDDQKAEPVQVKLSRELLKKFDIEAIKEFIKEEQAKDTKYREQITKILNVFFIIKKIEDYGSARKKVAEKDKQNINKEELEKSIRALNLRNELIEIATVQYPHFKKFVDEFETLILSIEVSSDNGNEVKNQFIYFPKHPVFHYLAKNTREDIMMRVERGTQRDKQISLINMKEEVKEEIYLNYTLNYKKIEWKTPFREDPWVKELPITSDFGNQVRGYARKCSFFICLLMVFFILVDHDTEQKTSTFTYSNRITEIIIQIFCKIQLLLTLGFVYIWVTLRRPLALKKYENDNKPEEVQSESIVPITGEKKSKEEQQGWENLSKLLYSGLSWVGSKIAIVKNKITECQWYKSTITTFIALYTYESGFLSILIFVLATLAGNFIGVEWYTIHIFDIFTDISELTNIFKAILNNFQKLTILSILAGAFILVFNVLSLSTYSHVIYEDDLPEDACEEIVDCVLVLYTSGAINDSMDQFETGRFFFDIGYIVFMQMMFQNIVGGIMMDAFAGLKEEDEFRDEDKQTNCYICGMNKPDMQKNAETFEKHIAKHDLWNYLYYILNLQEKDPTDFSGIQFDIDSKIKSENVTWFPAVKKQGDEGNEEKVMEQLQNNIQAMQDFSEQITQKSLQALEKAKEKANQIHSQNKRLRGQV